MATGFSGTLQLKDLDDFIAPSQECIKPVQLEPHVKRTKGNIKFEGETELYNATASPPKASRAKITLNDCLACSGCITSAEAVLVTQQSSEEFRRALKEHNGTHDGRLFVVTMSVQSVLSTAARFSLEPVSCALKLVTYLKQLGVDYVFDVSFAQSIALLESQKEFLERFKNNSELAPLPLIASSCPGWICYAEKTHGEVLPYISRVRSPQQIAGALVKESWAGSKGLSGEQVYHVTIMPCFDKKLEASREEFKSHIEKSKHVDCVITSVEIESMLDEDNVDLAALDSSTLDEDLSLSSSLKTHHGSGSGGFAHHIFTHAAREIFGQHIDAPDWKLVRNSDHQEATLLVEGDVKLRFALMYGFRNIQNLIMKIKRKKCPYHYVEIMACPSGCLNGGAQIRPVDGLSKELLAKLEEMYIHLDKVVPEDAVRDKLANLPLLQDDHMRRDSFYTSYKIVEKNITPLGIKW